MSLESQQKKILKVWSCNEHKSEDDLIDDDWNLYKKIVRVNDFDLSNRQNGQQMDRRRSMRQRNLRSSYQRDSYNSNRE
jgi:hypothetical protein